MENITKNNFRLIGLKLDQKTTNENGQASIDCGNLWQQFEKEQVFGSIPDKLNNRIYADYYDYEKDETKHYAYFIGCETHGLAMVPEGLNELLIPAQNYVKIPVAGIMTDCVADAWRHIWKSKMNRKFGFDFEIYDERSQDWNKAELDIFIS